METIPGMKYISALAVVLVMWGIVSWMVGSMLIPGPIDTFLRLGQEVRDPAFWKHVFTSFYRVIGGVACGFVTAVPLGLLLGANEKMDRWCSPLIYLSYPIPKIVFLPVFLLLFGLGDISKILLIALIIFFQLLLTTRDSARQIETEMIYSFNSLGGSRLHYFRHVVWPVSLPGIFTSLRVGTGIAVAVLFFVESIGTRRGLGFYIIDAWGVADYTGMFVGIIALSAIGVILYEIFDLLEKKVCQWKQI